VRNDATPPDFVNAHLVDQPRDGVKGPARLERADFLEILAFEV
jgi:hypothetical protein